MDIIIREAKVTDLPAILLLYSQLGQDDGMALDLAEAERIFATMKTYPDYRLYVAAMADKPVGTFALLIMDNLGHLGAKSAILEDLVVTDLLRGRGIGRMMMAYAGERCRAKKCYKMALSSNHNRKAAHRFYESLGMAWHGYSYLTLFSDCEKNQGLDVCHIPLDLSPSLPIEGEGA